jgi:hypothetical protein
MKVIWVKREGKYFCEQGWTDFRVICPSGYFVAGATSILPLRVRRRSQHKVAHGAMACRGPWAARAESLVGVKVFGLAQYWNAFRRDFEAARRNQRVDLDQVRGAG